jgi:hypothetical protein
MQSAKVGLENVRKTLNKAIKVGATELSMKRSERYRLLNTYYSNAQMPFSQQINSSITWVKPIFTVTFDCT